MQGRTGAGACPASRISDTLGNYINFVYNQRDVARGSGRWPTVQSWATSGIWSKFSTRATAFGQPPTSKVIFEYDR